MKLHALYPFLYTTASLPMMLGPKAQALLYLVPIKYQFSLIRRLNCQKLHFWVSGSVRIRSARLVLRMCSTLFSADIADQKYCGCGRENARAMVTSSSSISHYDVSKHNHHRPIKVVLMSEEVLP